MSSTPAVQPAPGPRRPTAVDAMRRMRWTLTLRAVMARRHLRRLPWLGRLLPWSLWCLLGAADAATVARELARRAARPLVFVQIGSNDGISNDPLHRTVRAHRWQGLLVEPVPELFARLVANYRGCPGLVFENVAVGAVDGALPLYLADPRPGDPAWVTQLASFDRDVVLSHRDELPDLDARVRTVEVEAVTLPVLLARHRLEAVDLLHVDAEGFDLQVISQIDVAAPWAPRFVIFEKKHLDPDDYRTSLAAFRRAGYRRVGLWPDELLYRPGALA